MPTVNIISVVENIVTFLHPYSTEILCVSRADRPYVLRRLQHELRRRIPSDCSAELVELYRELDQAIQMDLDLLENEGQAEMNAS